MSLLGSTPPQDSPVDFALSLLSMLAEKMCRTRLISLGIGFRCPWRRLILSWGGRGGGKGVPGVLKEARNSSCDKVDRPDGADGRPYGLH